MNQIIDIKRTASGGEPVTLAEAKAQLRVTFTDDDTEITALIPKARRHVENYCNISIVSTSITMVARLCDCWKLPYGPVKSITSVAMSDGSPGSGPVQYGNTDINWDTTGDMFNVSTAGLYSVTYNAGMGTIPEDLKDVILSVITFLYENRGKTKDQADLRHILSNADAYQNIWS